MWDWLEKANELKLRGQLFVLATIIDRKGSAPRELGAKMIITGDGDVFGTVGGGQLEHFVKEDGERFLKEAANQRVPYPLCFRTGQCCGGAVDVFYEVIGMRPQLYVFGAGHVGQAIARTLFDTPFIVHLVDEREEWVHHPGVPAAVFKHKAAWQGFCKDALWDERSVYAVIMTHDHALDEEILGGLMHKPLRYLGLIGSKTKWARFTRQLKLLGFTDNDLARVTCPIGYDTGGKSPKEIAISLAAELLALYHGRKR